MHFDLATPLGSRRNCFDLYGLVVFDFVIEWSVRLALALVVIVHFVVFEWKVMLLLVGTRVPNLGPLQQKQHQIAWVWWWCFVVVVVVMVVESRVPNLALLDVMVVVIVVVMGFVVVLVHSQTMMKKKKNLMKRKMN